MKLISTELATAVCFVACAVNMFLLDCQTNKLKKSQQDQREEMAALRQRMATDESDLVDCQTANDRQLTTVSELQHQTEDLPRLWHALNRLRDDQIKCFCADGTQWRRP
jgi:hypothetical protein